VFDRKYTIKIYTEDNSHEGVVFSVVAAYVRLEKNIVFVDGTPLTFNPNSKIEISSQD
jgi:hypothetical protein